MKQEGHWWRGTDSVHPALLQLCRSLAEGLRVCLYDNVCLCCVSLCVCVYVCVYVSVHLYVHVYVFVHVIVSCVYLCAH